MHAVKNDWNLIAMQEVNILYINKDSIIYQRVNRFRNLAEFFRDVCGRSSRNKRQY